MASRSGSQQSCARQTAGDEHNESELPTASMSLDDAVEYIGTELRAEAALQKRDGPRGKIAREKELGKLVYEVACRKGSAKIAQGMLYDLAANVKEEGLDEVLLRKVFQYLNRFYVKQEKKTPI